MTGNGKAVSASYDPTDKNSVYLTSIVKYLYHMRSFILFPFRHLWCWNSLGCLQLHLTPPADSVNIFIAGGFGKKTVSCGDCPSRKCRSGEGQGYSGSSIDSGLKVRRGRWLAVSMRRESITRRGAE